MDRDGEPKKRIPADIARHLVRTGAPLPSLGQLSAGTRASRQLIRYYFDEPTDMLLGVCDCLAEAYRMALVNGVNGLDGQARLDFILDFYFDLVDAVPKPRDDQAYDAMMAYAAGAPRVRDALRDQYTLLGQVLALEIKIVHPHLTLDHCAEVSYLFTCLMYGHWKMVASLGLAEDHKHITRRAVDRIITLYAQEGARPKDWPRPWRRQD
ncbi:MAG: TetR/AcrR family transcriptional regulator [Gemmobacter sp.]